MPYTLNLISYTLLPYALYPEPDILYPLPYALYPEPDIPYPITLCPIPYALLP
jgi:hypothetical protein